MAAAMCPSCGQYYWENSGHICPKLPGDLPPPNAYRVPRPEDVRGSTHGDYGQMSRVIQETKAIWRSGPSWSQLSAAQKEALELIATKVGRIVCGDPNHRDHWDDVAGYARKASETIPTKKE